MGREEQNPTGQRPAGADAAGRSGTVQGEGDYEAARRHRERVENYLENSDVESDARAAEPSDAAEAQELEQAEAEGRSHAKGGRKPSER